MQFVRGGPPSSERSGKSRYVPPMVPSVRRPSSIGDVRDHAWSPFDHKAADLCRPKLSNCSHHSDILIKSGRVDDGRTAAALTDVRTRQPARLKKITVMTPCGWRSAII